MIGKLKYQDVLSISKTLTGCINELNALEETKASQEVMDFASTVEVYAKYLETLVELNEDADKALKDLNETSK